VDFKASCRDHTHFQLQEGALPDTCLLASALTMQMDWVAVQQEGVLDYWEEHPELAQQGFTVEDLQYAANVVGAPF
jgi:hypothetical protein